MLYYFLKYLVRIAVKIYFKDVIIFGMDRLSKDKALVIAANHPSAFVEPCLIGSYFPVEVHFMTRGDLFKPAFKWFFDGTNQIPIFRQRDGIRNLRQNAASFEKAFKVLESGGRVTIFPEATTKEVKRIRRLKNGASRLILGTAKKYNIVPLISAVVTNYEELHRWRSYVFLHISQAFDPTEMLEEGDNAMNEITAETYARMKAGSIHIDRIKDEKWVNVLVQTVTEEWRYNRLKCSKLEIFKLLRRVAAISEAEDAEKEKLKPLADKIHFLNEKTQSHLGVPVLKFGIGNTLAIIFWAILSIPAMLLLGLPWLLARKVLRSVKFNHEFQIPVYLGILMLGSVILVLILLIVLAFNIGNMLIWTFILTLPIGLYSLRKCGDLYYKWRDSARLSKLSSQELEMYKQQRNNVLKYFDL